MSSKSALSGVAMLYGAITLSTKIIRNYRE
ncbi:hypothetical protein CSPAE12_05649 [Colletotrichum incanum]|nr:hypothetical protein CSPAE12_05649 [Colletotrichum incanum]